MTRTEKQAERARSAASRQRGKQEEDEYWASVVRLQERRAEKQAAAEKREARHAEAQAIVSKGTCPDCGAKLRRNLSLSGWWQCGRSGAPGFKSPEYEGTGDCHFQTFTA